MPFSKRSPRNKRSKNPNPMRLTERDIAILQAVYEYRVLSAQQIQKLFFLTLKKAQERLYLLYHHGLLDRKFSGLYFDKMNTPILYILDRRGAEELQKAGKLSHEWNRKSKQVSIFFLHHALAINEVRVAVVKAAEQFGYELLEWRGEAELKLGYDHVKIAGIVEPVAIIPDSYFALKTSNRAMHFFLEVDRSTESHKTFKRKIRAYQVYCGSEEAKKRFGGSKFRVLTVTGNIARLQNLKLATEASGGKSRFWFTTASQISTKTVLSEAIWQIAGRSEQTALIS